MFPDGSGPRWLLDRGLQGWPACVFFGEGIPRFVTKNRTQRASLDQDVVWEANHFLPPLPVLGSKRCLFHKGGSWPCRSQSFHWRLGKLGGHRS